MNLEQNHLGWNKFSGLQWWRGHIFGNQTVPTCRTVGLSRRPNSPRNPTVNIIWQQPISGLCNHTLADTSNVNLFDASKVGGMVAPLRFCIFLWGVREIQFSSRDRGSADPNSARREYSFGHGTVFPGANPIPAPPILSEHSTNLASLIHNRCLWGWGSLHELRSIHAFFIYLPCYTLAA